MVEEAVETLLAQASQKFPFEAVEGTINASKMKEICSILGVSPDLIKRFQREGLSVDEADKVAYKLGEHPSAIWPEWSDIPLLPESLLDAAEDFMRANKRCGKCLAWVDREKFHRRRASTDGRARYCMMCTKKYEEAKRGR
ncbi:MAG TPA: hypothetical protein PK181_10365 [Methanothrix soehngenii]|jgi:hypothetical protein|nr:hypothetical protein [Methanothrix soehngenii]